MSRFYSYTSNLTEQKENCFKVSKFIFQGSKRNIKNTQTSDMFSDRIPSKILHATEEGIISKTLF